MYQQFIDRFIQQETLPESYREDILQWFLPLLPDLEVHQRESGAMPFLLGINGAQGTGKSTLAKLLAGLLECQGRRVVVLSIDDFYYSRAERARLARDVHPLLASRGVPGTHDVKQALQTLRQLRHSGRADPVRLPRFDKATDDCVAAASCPVAAGPFDYIILEGWFVGATPQPESELVTPINTLEQEEDRAGRWRKYVNEQLAGDYQLLFEQIDVLLMLRPPSFAQVYEWRALQEDKLRQAAAKPGPVGMDEAQLARFIQHFERLTRHCLQALPACADISFYLDEQHRVLQRADRPMTR